jgi:hypothetical protein
LIKKRGWHENQSDGTRHKQKESTVYNRAWNQLEATRGDGRSVAPLGFSDHLFSCFPAFGSLPRVKYKVTRCSCTRQVLTKIVLIVFHTVLFTVTSSSS